MRTYTSGNYTSAQINLIRTHQNKLEFFADMGVGEEFTFSETPEEYDISIHKRLRNKELIEKVRRSGGKQQAAWIWRTTRPLIEGVNKYV